MRENKVERNQRLVKLLGGILLCLFSISLIINYGYIVRTLTFPFLYIFGIFSYLFYILWYVQGMAFIFVNHKLKIKKFYLITGSLVLLAACILVTAIYSLNKPLSMNFVNEYWNNFTSLEGGYYGIKFINVFSNNFAGGFLGYLFVGLMTASLGKAACFAISITLFVICVLIMCIPLIIKVYRILSKKEDIADKKKFEKEDAKEEAHRIKNEEKRAKLKAIQDEKLHFKKAKEAIFLHADEVPNEDLVQPKQEESVQSTNFDNRFEQSSGIKISPAVDDSQNQDVGMVSPVKFAFSNEPEVVDTSSKQTTYEENAYPVDHEIALADENIKQEEIQSVSEPIHSIEDNSFDNNPQNNQVEVTEVNKIEDNESVSDVIMDDRDAFFDEQDSVQEIKNEDEDFVEPIEQTKEPSFSFDEEEELPISSLEDNIIQPDEEIQKDEPIVQATINKSELSSMSQSIQENNSPVIEEIPPEPAKKKERVKWIPPSTDLLNSYPIEEAIARNTELAEERVALLNKAFEEYHVSASCTGYTIGPSITRYHIDYASTGMIKNVANMIQDLSRKLNGAQVRFEPTIEGYSYSGLECPNAVSTIVSFKEVFEALPDVHKHPTSVAFGKNITGEVVSADYAEFPHLLVSGTSGSGKSVFVNSLITTLIMRLSPDDFKIVLVDPKQVEMLKYAGIPHLLCPIITEASKAKVMLTKLVDLMNQRYRMMAGADCSTNIGEYNEYAVEHNIETMPYIMVVLDEFNDLVYGCKDIGTPIVLLAQKARAAGIHILIATQRPSTDVITGTIKANLNTRVSLSAASSVDSVTIVDEGGAEKLLGNGDMLVKSPLISKAGLVRLQGCLIKGKEIAHIVNYLKENYSLDYNPDFLDLEEKATEAANQMIGSGIIAGDVEGSDEEKYLMIKEWASTQEYVSMSKIQRECGVGFNRAGKIVRRLQDDGVIATTTDIPSRGFKVINSDRHYEGNDIPTSDEYTDKGGY